MSARATMRDVHRFVQRARECNSPFSERNAFVPFRIGELCAGFLTDQFAARLMDSFPSVFKRVDTMRESGSGRHVGGTVRLSKSLSTPEARTEAIGRCMRRLADDKLLTGWRDELLPVATGFNQPALFLLERAAVPAFGVKAYGVHVNCFVRLPDSDEVEIWVARRSKSKTLWPGMLDHAVAGGQPYGISPADNVVKEAGEEAGIPEAMARKAVATGVVSYEVTTKEGLKRDVLFCYDLELPASFVPTARDGEVEEFFRLPVSRVWELVESTDEYKPNCRLVIMDFLVRHGYITPEMPGYLALLNALRAGDIS